MNSHRRSIGEYTHSCCMSKGTNSGLSFARNTDGSDSEEEADDYEDEESSDEGWKSKRRTTSKKKPAAK